MMFTIRHFPQFICNLILTLMLVNTVLYEPLSVHSAKELTMNKSTEKIEGSTTVVTLDKTIASDNFVQFEFTGMDILLENYPTEMGAIVLPNSKIKMETYKNIIYLFFGVLFLMLLAQFWIKTKFPIALFTTFCLLIGASPLSLFDTIDSIFWDYLQATFSEMSKRIHSTIFELAAWSKIEILLLLLLVLNWSWCVIDYYIKKGKLT